MYAIELLMDMHIDALVSLTPRCERAKGNEILRVAISSSSKKLVVSQKLPRSKQNVKPLLDIILNDQRDINQPKREKLKDRKNIRRRSRRRNRFKMCETERCVKKMFSSLCIHIFLSNDSDKCLIIRHPHFPI